MIRISQPDGADRGALTSAEQHGLNVLLDLTRLVRVDRTDASVGLELVESSTDADLARCMAQGWHLEVADGVVRIPRSVLRLVNAIAGAADEQHATARDRYGRVLPTDNPLVRIGAPDQPVVARAAGLLREAAINAAGRREVLLVSPWPNRTRWAVAVTHDLDVVALWPGFTALRVMELIRKGRLGLAAQVVAGAIGSLLENPVESAARNVLDAESSRAIPSTWFILCGTPSASSMAAGDLTYRPESGRATRIVGAIRASGHELGLHGSFASYDRVDVFREQRSRLSGLVQSSVGGVRQHFLRMVPGATQRAMADAGFAYDSTFGFADRNGFRLGLADVVPLWDESRQQTLAIEEAPFSWMDRALSKYQGVEDPRSWVEDGLRIAERVRETEGLWVGIWHPNLDTALGYPGALRAFELLLDRLRERRPHFTTLGDAVRWRVARRQARVSGRRPDGTFDLMATDGAEIELERPDGSPVSCRRASA